MEPTLGWMTLTGIGLISLGASILTAAAGLMVRDRLARLARSTAEATSELGSEFDLVVDEPTITVEPTPVEPIADPLDGIEERIDELARRVNRLSEDRLAFHARDWKRSAVARG